MISPQDVMTTLAFIRVARIPTPAIIYPPPRVMTALAFLGDAQK